MITVAIHSEAREYIASLWCDAEHLCTVPVTLKSAAEIARRANVATINGQCRIWADVYPIGFTVMFFDDGESVVWETPEFSKFKEAEENVVHRVET